MNANVAEKKKEKVVALREDPVLDKLDGIDDRDLSVVYNKRWIIDSGIRVENEVILA